MSTFVALALRRLRRPAVRPMVVACAVGLQELADRVAAQAPTARLTLFDHAPAVRVEGLPIWGLACAPGRPAPQAPATCVTTTDG